MLSDYGSSVVELCFRIAKIFMQLSLSFKLALFRRKRAQEIILQIFQGKAGTSGASHQNLELSLYL